MKIGDKVRLTRKAVKDFYGTEKNFEMYFTTDPTEEQLRALVEDYDFNLGKEFGVIIGKGYYEGVMLVSHGISTSYVEEENLELSTKKIKAYCCSTSVEYHIPDDIGGIRIFFSERDLRLNKKCIDSKDGAGCRVCEIEIEIPEN